MAERIEKLVRRIIRENCDAEQVNEIGLDENLQDLGINSRNFLKVVIALEREFNIEFDDETTTVKDFETLKRIIDCIENKLAALEN